MSDATIERLRVVDVEVEVSSVSGKYLSLVVGSYAILVSRTKKRKRKENRKYLISIWKAESGGARPVAEVIAIKDVEILARKLAEIEDDFIKENADQLAQTIIEYIDSWPLLLRKKRAEEILFRRIGSPHGETSIWRGTNHVEPNIELTLQDILRPVEPIPELKIDKLKIRLGKLSKEPTLEDIFQIYRHVFTDEIGDLLEVIVDTGLTLKLVDRDRGLYKIRPNWLLAISPPSALKTSTMGLIRRSRYVEVLGNVTAASFLPADPEEPALIDKIHNKVAIFSTLSQIAEKNEKDAREILAILESVYDGEYVRDTAKGTRRGIVDTVVIGAMTTETFEQKFREPMIAYGSRWLIYRYDIGSEKALNIGDLLMKPRIQEFMSLLEQAVSYYFTIALENLGIDDFERVQFTTEKKHDIRVLAKLLASLRVAFHRRRYREETEDGKQRWVEEFEITQTDVPIRSYIQLYNFVRANVLIRNVPVMVGLPTVDDHAMRLATKLALGSSSKYMADIILLLLKYGEGPSPLSHYDVAKMLKISRSTVTRYINVLFQIGVLEDTKYPMLADEYANVLRKYLLGDRDG